MTTFHPDPRYGGYVAYMKGAPDVVLGLCSQVLEDGVIRPLTGEWRRNILEVNEALAANAQRVLAVAFRPLEAVPDNPQPEDVERGFVFVGLLGMIDPARPEVAAAIQTARRAGIETIMITGDYPHTAVAIGKEIGLLREGDLALTGAELERMDVEELEERVERVAVFARVSPQHKVKIVDALKARGHVVAMTGDGVNDAPALKRSHIGVAMGITGTDVSKETADMVLTDDNYASIVLAIEQGRVIYANIRKFVYYLLSCNMAEITILLVAMLAGAPLPLVPIQLLVLNLITDGAPALALGVERGDPDIMDQPPRRVDEPIVGRLQDRPRGRGGPRSDDGLCHAVDLRTAAGLYLALGAVLAVGHRRLFQQVDAVGRAGLAVDPAGHYLCALPGPGFRHNVPDSPGLVDHAALDPDPLDSSRNQQVGAAQARRERAEKAAGGRLAAFDPRGVRQGQAICSCSARRAAARARIWA